ncbi:MAG: response regulator transcription factor [Magnetococcales bacterium]|nr:response regulator transcription factor [Magnetococcales bacterium]
MNKMASILIVDDDADLCQMVQTYMNNNGLQILIASDGRGMRKILDNTSVDLIILDLMLRDEDGLVLCRNLRARSDIPVLILSARGEEMDRIIGLEMGADDYLPKPFHMRELLARVKSILRRGRAHQTDDRFGDDVVYRFAGWMLDNLSRQLRSPDGGHVLELSSSEHTLLRVFLTHPNKVLTREQLLNLSRGHPADADDRSIDMQISRLRRRLLETPKSSSLIRTVRSTGYLFSAEVDRGVKQKEGTLVFTPIVAPA